MRARELDDTIAALATPPGEGGLAVIRMSGPRAFEIAAEIFQTGPDRSRQAFEPHKAYLGRISDGTGRVFDQALLIHFPAPRSYTGEDVAELSLHGGWVLSRKVLDLIYQRGARPAEPGEFTRRAFLNGKIDLTQAEAVLDLIHAKSVRALEAAVHQLSGGLTREMKSVKEELLRMLAHMEAFLDFPEDDLEVYSDENFRGRFKGVKQKLQGLLAGFTRGMLIREGASLVLLGKRNAGKSSLFNALLARDRAIVSEIPGTTRDVLEEAIEIQGWYLRLTDTAGLDLEAGDSLESLGMERTRRTLETGSLFLFVLDGSGAWEEADTFAAGHLPKGKPVIAVVNKSDLEKKIEPSVIEKKLGPVPRVALSALRREGMERLEDAIAAVLNAQGLASEGGQVTRLRHKAALEQALRFLTCAEESFRSRGSLETVTLDLRNALEAIRELIGEVYTEDLLDVIFSEFCIGK